MERKIYDRIRQHGLIYNCSCGHVRGVEHPIGKGQCVWTVAKNRTKLTGCHRTHMLSNGQIAIKKKHVDYYDIKRTIYSQNKIIHQI